MRRPEKGIREQPPSAHRNVRPRTEQEIMFVDIICVCATSRQISGWNRTRESIQRSVLSTEVSNDCEKWEHFFFYGCVPPVQTRSPPRCEIGIQIGVSDEDVSICERLSVRTICNN